MAIVSHYTQEQRNNQAARIGKIFGLEDAGMKMTREGWHMEPCGHDEVLLTVTLVAEITTTEAENILNAAPVEEDNE